MLEHDACKGDEVEACEDLGGPLIVLGEPSEAGGPGEGTLDDPSSGQENEAAFGLGQLDDAEFDAVLGGGDTNTIEIMEPERCQSSMRRPSTNPPKCWQ